MNRCATIALALLASGHLVLGADDGAALRSLSVTLDPTAPARAEPVTVTCEFVNRGPRPARVVDLTSSLRISVSDVPGQWYVVSTRDRDVVGYDPQRQLQELLAPGAKLIWRLVLQERSLPHGSEPMFGEPGHYWVKASARYVDKEQGDTLWESAPAAVDVREPAAAEREALALWSAPALVHLVQIGPTDFEPVPVPELDELLAKYPRSLYADLARRHLPRLASVKPMPLFADDKRLDHYLSPNLGETELSAALRELSDSAMVQLSADASLTTRRVTVRERQALALRDLMRRLAGEIGAEWVVEGQGYELRPLPPKAAEAEDK